MEARASTCTIIVKIDECQGMVFDCEFVVFFIFFLLELQKIYLMPLSGPQQWTKPGFSRPPRVMA